MLVGRYFGEADGVRAEAAGAAALVQFDEGVPDMREIKRQRRCLSLFLPLLAADGRDMVAQRAAPGPGYPLRALEMIPPVGDYFFEDASVKFARLAMNASTWSRMTGKSR